MCLSDRVLSQHPSTQPPSRSGVTLLTRKVLQGTCWVWHQERLHCFFVRKVQQDPAFCTPLPVAVRREFCPTICQKSLKMHTGQSQGPTNYARWRSQCLFGPSLSGAGVLLTWPGVLVTLLGCPDAVWPKWQEMEKNGVLKCCKTGEFLLHADLRNQGNLRRWTLADMSKCGVRGSRHAPGWLAGPPPPEVGSLLPKKSLVEHITFNLSKHFMYAMRDEAASVHNVQHQQRPKVPTAALTSSQFLSSGEHVPLLNFHCILPLCSIVGGEICCKFYVCIYYRLAFLTV